MKYKIIPPAFLYMNSTALLHPIYLNFFNLVVAHRLVYQKQLQKETANQRSKFHIDQNQINLSNDRIVQLLVLWQNYTHAMNVESGLNSIITSEGPTNHWKKGTVNAALNSDAHFVGWNSFLNARTIG